METKTETPEVKQPDLVTRASQVKLSEPKQEITEPDFDFKDIEKISDPTAKDYALKAYKSFQKGFNQKFQEIAETRKALEAAKNEMSTWTPERVQALLKDEKFVTAAKSIIETQGSQPTAEEYSSMSEAEKLRVKKLEDEIAQLKNVSAYQYKQQEDEKLKSKYANYNPQAMDIITNEVLMGKTQITREHIWKSMDYDEAVKRAYELGRQDRQLDNKEKISSMSFPETPTLATSSEKLEKEPNEGDRDFLRRIFLKNIAAGQKK